MDRLELERKGYRFEVSAFQVSVFRGTRKTVFFDSWPNPRPLPACWGLALAEATRHFVAERLS